jgi:hypothetical protein
MRNPPQHGKYLANSYECMSNAVWINSGTACAGMLIWRQSYWRAYRQAPLAFKRDLQAPALATAPHLTRPQSNPKKGAVAPVHASTRLRIEM